MLVNYIRAEHPDRASALQHRRRHYAHHRLWPSLRIERGHGLKRTSQSAPKRLLRRAAKGMTFNAICLSHVHRDRPDMNRAGRNEGAAHLSAITGSMRIAAMCIGVGSVDCTTTTVSLPEVPAALISKSAV
jgi:hypothetical protein